jgi:signal transduction histidine kinase
MFSNDIAFTVIVTTLLILLLILGVIITIVLANRRHIQQEVKMAQLQVTYEQELRQAEHEVQEQVLTNVARDLHDNIGQLLTYINIQVEQGKLSKPETAPMLAPISDTVQDTIQQVRLLSRSLNSDFLENGGLIQAITQEISRLQQFRSIDIAWTQDDTEPALDKNQRIMTFRIFQEILNNALKHSGAKRIEISLKAKEGFALTVADNGRGFDLEAKRAAGGSGIRNMEKRAALANLSLTITTAPGKGSSFVLSI